MHISKFESVNGVPDETQIEAWAEGYFHNLLNMFNTFFTQVSVAEAVERMSKIPFDQLIREALEGENEIIVEKAVAVVNEKVEMELEFMRAYLD